MFNNNRYAGEQIQRQQFAMPQPQVPNAPMTNWFNQTQ